MKLELVKLVKLELVKLIKLELVKFVKLETLTTFTAQKRGLLLGQRGMGVGGWEGSLIIPAE